MFKIYYNKFSSNNNNYSNKLKNFNNIVNMIYISIKNCKRF